MELIVRDHGTEIKVGIEPAGTPHAYIVRVGDRTYEVDSRVTGPSLRSLVIAGRQYEVAVRREEEGRYAVAGGADQRVLEVADPLTYLAGQSQPGAAAQGKKKITAYMPGRVVSILVAVGAEVTPGQGLIVLEAMKMQNEIQAERAGTIRQILVTAGQTVEGGDPLFEIS